VRCAAGQGMANSERREKKEEKKRGGGNEREKKEEKKEREGKEEPVESSSPLEWPAVGGQLGLAAVSFLHSLSRQGHFFLKSFFINFYEFFQISFFKI
jgi:hypothetical protein